MSELVSNSQLDQEEKIKEVTKLTLKQNEELKQIDMKLVLQLDQKVRQEGSSILQGFSVESRQSCNKNCIKNIFYI